jgi:hypothetical protein
MKTLLSKVLLMAVMAALTTVAAAAPALAEGQQISPSDISGVSDELPSSPNGPFDKQTICDKYPDICGGQIEDPVLDPVLDPDKGPKICKVYPEICGGPLEDPVLDPTTPPEPPTPEECKDNEVKDTDGKCVPKPPENCPDGQEKDKDDKCVPKPPETCPYGQAKDKDGKCAPEHGEGTGGGYDNNGGGGYGNGGYGGGIVYRGVTYINGFLPSTYTTTVENAGNAVKSNLPAPVAKKLPNTGGGWTSLALAGGALLLTGRFLIRRFSS